MINVSKLPDHIREDLNERGHSNEKIAKMSLEHAFDEWCGWHLGDPGWGPTFRAIQNALKEAEEKNDLP